MLLQEKKPILFLVPLMFGSFFRVDGLVYPLHMVSLGYVRDLDLFLGLILV